MIMTSEKDTWSYKMYVTQTLQSNQQIRDQFVKSRLQRNNCKFQF
jgi:hypothetical protein